MTEQFLKSVALTEVWEMIFFFFKKGVQASPAFSVVDRAASSGPDIGRSLRVMTCGHLCDLADLSIQVFSHTLDPRGQ